MLVFLIGPSRAVIIMEQACNIASFEITIMRERPELPGRALVAEAAVASHYLAEAVERDGVGDHPVDPRGSGRRAEGVDDRLLRRLCHRLEEGVMARLGMAPFAEPRSDTSPSGPRRRPCRPRPAT